MPVLLGHPLVVLQAAVRRLQAVVQLEAFEEVVIGPRLVRGAEVDVDHTPDRPDPTGLALDPDRDALLAAVLVHTADGPLGEASLVGAPAHRARVIQSSRVTRFADLLKQPFSFLFARGSSEERVAAYVIREHELGRSLEEILRDRYVQNRLTPAEQNRLLDRPEVIRSLGDDMIEEARRAHDLV